MLTEENQQNLHSREPQGFCASKILHCDTLNSGMTHLQIAERTKAICLLELWKWENQEKAYFVLEKQKDLCFLNLQVCVGQWATVQKNETRTEWNRKNRVPKMFLPGPPAPCSPLGSLPHLCWHQGFCLWFLRLSFIPSLQSLAHTTPSRQYPSHSEASMMNTFFSKFNTKNCFNDLSPSWKGLSHQIMLTCSKGINHSFCFLRIYYHLEVCVAYGDDYTCTEWMNDWWLYCQPFPILCSPRRDVNASPGKGHSQDHGCGEHSAPELLATNRFFWRELQRGRQDRPGTQKPASHLLPIP